MQDENLGKHAMGNNPAAESAIDSAVQSSQGDAATQAQADTQGTGSVRRGDVTIIRDAENPDMVTIRTRKRKKRSHSSKKKRSKPKLSVGKKVAIGIVVALVVLVLGGVGAAMALIHVGNQNLHLEAEPIEEEDLIEAPADVKRSEYGEGLEYKGHHYKFNDNIISVMVIGHDDESSYGLPNCADANVLVALDTETKKARAIMIPRDSYVYVDKYQDNVFTETKQMNLLLSYAVDVDTEAQRAENTVKSVSRIFYGVPLKYYVALDESALADASTAVGGVELEALDTIPGANYEAGDTVLLMGEDAFHYVQYRDTEVYESALDRQQRQVQFVQAFLKKASSNGARGLVDLYNSVADELTTNLGASEVSYLASLYAGGKNGSLEVVQLKGKTEEFPDEYGDVHEHIFLSKDNVTKIMLDTFYTKVD